jgi:hypothetical protein
VSKPEFPSAGDVFCDAPPADEPVLNAPGVAPFLLLLGFEAAMYGLVVALLFPFEAVVLLFLLFGSRTGSLALMRGLGRAFLFAELAPLLPEPAAVFEPAS